MSQHEGASFLSRIRPFSSVAPILIMHPRQTLSILGLLIFLITAPAQAQHVFRAHVLDAHHNEPLAGVNALVEGTSIGGATGPEGRITLEGIPAGSQDIADIPTRIETIAGEEIDEKISMEPSNISMLLNESPRITVQQTSAVSGNAGIRIQGSTAATRRS